MKARFKNDTQLEIVTDFSLATDEPISEMETFKAGEEIDFDIVDYAERVIDGELVEDENILNIQFGNGSMAYGISREWLDIIDDDLDDDEDEQQRRDEKNGLYPDKWNDCN